MSDNDPDTGTPVGAIEGGLMSPLYAGRTTKVFLVTEYELEHISSLNVLSSAFFSAASAFLFFGTGLWVNAAYQTSPTPESTILTNVGAPASFVISVACFALGIWAQATRKSGLARIRDESSNPLSE